MADKYDHSAILHQLLHPVNAFVLIIDITYRQGLGYDKRAIRTQLLLFDRYLAQQQNISAPLQPLFFLQLRADLQMQPSSVNKVLYATGCFFEYLVRKGDYLANPLRDIPPRPQHAFIPFVSMAFLHDFMINYYLVFVKPF